MGPIFWGGETSNKYMVVLRDFPKKKHVNVLFGPHVDPCIITPMQWPKINRFPGVKYPYAMAL